MSTPKNLLNIQDLKTGLDIYKKGIESRPANTTQAVWFSLQDLKEYIEFIEKNAKDKNIVVSGIRLHVIASKDGADRFSLALCPTAEVKTTDGLTRQMSFDPLYSENEKPLDLNEILKNSQNANKGSSVLNYGRICPDFC